MRQSTRLTLFALLVVVAGLLSYLPGLFGPLLFDDQAALTKNELVQIDGTAIDQWRVAALSSNSGPLRRPLAMASFAANHAIEGGFSPVGLKAVNLGIHCVIAALLFFLCLSVLENLGIGSGSDTRRLIALTAAAIWLLHPLNVSTVLYAVQRMAQLATLFVLAGLLLFMRYRQRWAISGASTGELIAAVMWLLLLTALAALSKENGALLPWLIVVLEVCIFRGVWAGRPIRWLTSMGWIALVLPVFLVLAVLVVSPDILLGRYSGREFTVEERLLTQGRLLWRYLGWICLPNINDMGFQHDDIPTSTGFFAPLSTIIALVSWVFLLLLSFRLRQRYPLLLLAVLFFLVGHSLESTIWPLEMVYEHRNYLAGVLVCLALASLLVLPASGSNKLSVWVPVLGACIILSLLLVIRVQSWSSELTLSATNLARHPDSSRSNYFYANALLRQYRRADQLGLSEREKSEYLLLSRHYFERMYQTNNRDVAALVLLFYLDSHYFTELQEQVDWLDKLETLLDSRALQPSDWNALTTLFDIFSARPELVPELRVMALMDKLSTRYPRSIQLMFFRYRYLSALQLEPEELLGELAQAQELAPQVAWVYLAQMREYERSRDLASMYETARMWLRYDPHRYDLHRIKELFVDAETQVQVASD